jgi:murein DD-endopeptidase MepM/ murein hydrolase activator NlpD
LAWYRATIAALLLLCFSGSEFPAAAAAKLPAPPAAIGATPTPAGAQEGDSTRIVVAVRKGDTLGSILAAQRVGDGSAASAESAIGQTFDPRRLRAGDRVVLTFVRRPAGRELAAIHLGTGNHGDLTVLRAPDGSFTSSLDAQAKATEPLRTLRFKRVDGVVVESIEATLRLASVPGPVIADLSSALADDPDLPRRPPAGTRFELLYSLPSSAAPAKRPQLFYASFGIGKREHHLYRYDARTIRRTVFVDEQGQAIMPFSPLRPLDVSRVSSPFGWRIHPVLNTPEFHKGVDFPAPKGTPVHAASAGRVVEAGWHGNYGLMVRLRHGANVETTYAHLEKLAPRIAAGSEVKAGETVGYVGSTGLSTGPHLYYEVYVDGAPVNPLKAHPNVIVAVESDELKKLLQETQTIEKLASR